MKPIIVCYLNVGRLDSADINQLLNNCMKSLKENQDVFHYIVPIRKGESRIECINPVLVNQEVYNEALQNCEKTKEVLNYLLKENKLIL